MWGTATFHCSRKKLGDATMCAVGGYNGKGVEDQNSVLPNSNIGYFFFDVLSYRLGGLVW